LEELLRTNDIVLISFVEALLRDAGIDHMVVDQNMSVIEGSLGVLPRRVLVVSDSAAAARRLLKDAGVGAEIVSPKGSA
jgi:Putative prokaryotic signal transducing protein